MRFVMGFLVAAETNGGLVLSSDSQGVRACGSGTWRTTVYKGNTNGKEQTRKHPTAFFALQAKIDFLESDTETAFFDLRLLFFVHPAFVKSCGLDNTSRNNVLRENLSDHNSLGNVSF
jgi:hypothetical protein